MEYIYINIEVSFTPVRGMFLNCSTVARSSHHTSCFFACFFEEIIRIGVIK